MDVRALVAFDDPRTQRAYNPGDPVGGLSEKRAEVFARQGLVVIGSEGLRPYQYPTLPIDRPKSPDFGTSLERLDAHQLDSAQLAAEYDQRYRDNPEKWANTPDRNETAFAILSKHLDHEPREVIDVGCGVGHTLAYFHERWPKTELFGLDLSQEALKLTKKRLPDVRTIHADIGEMSVPPRFEVVICLGTAEHFTNLIPGLCRLRDMIAPEGYGYIEVPHNLAYSPGEEGFRRLMGGSRQWEWHLERSTWEMALYEAGLQIRGAYAGSREMWRFIWVVQ